MRNVGRSVGPILTLGKNIRDNNWIKQLFGAYIRHFATFRSGLGLRSIGSQASNRYRLAVKIRQSTVAQRRPEST